MAVASSKTSPVGAIVALVVGIVLILIGQFLLDSLADSNDTWHWIQHGTIFVGGLAVGIGATLLYVRGQRTI